VLYWSCESKKIAHGSTCRRIDFLPIVPLLLPSSSSSSFAVRRHRSMLLLFINNEIFRSSQHIFYQSNKSIRKKTYFLFSRMFFLYIIPTVYIFNNHWLISIFTLSLLLLLLFLSAYINISSLYNFFLFYFK
jgi:hypothetical protein